VRPADGYPGAFPGGVCGERGWATEDAAVYEAQGWRLRLEACSYGARGRRGYRVKVKEVERVAGRGAWSWCGVESADDATSGYYSIARRDDGEDVVALCNEFCVSIYEFDGSGGSTLLGCGAAVRDVCEDAEVVSLEQFSDAKAHRTNGENADVGQMSRHCVKTCTG